MIYISWYTCIAHVVTGMLLWDLSVDSFDVPKCWFSWYSSLSHPGLGWLYICSECCFFQYWYYRYLCVFIRPFEKRDVLCRGNVRPSVCPSVCPSVRPSVRVFRTFLQHALRYQFETWYIHSVGGTTCRVWVASQLGYFDLVYSQK